MIDEFVHLAALRELRELVERQVLNDEEINRRISTIYSQVLSQSRHLRVGNFTTVSAADLECLFGLYDGWFFRGLIQKYFHHAPVSKLRFRLSRRMTRAGGKTFRFTHRVALPGQPPRVDYEIAISTTLLFQTFGDVTRPISVTGKQCKDRLEALQRVFEHELVHLVEMLAYGESSCSAPQFRNIAVRLFGHTDVTHDLVTARERARVSFNIRVGDKVTFVFEGRRQVGVINRITRRATVLVEDARGEPYSDGKRYLKFYIPLPMLQRVGSGMDEFHG